METKAEISFTPKNIENLENTNKNLSPAHISQINFKFKKDREPKIFETWKIKTKI
jgi:hypothetical protein